MNIFQKLATKPWTEASGFDDEITGWDTHPAKISLRLFLTVVGVFFALFCVTYYTRMLLDDWRPLNDPQILIVNTILLIIGSIAFQGARWAARDGKLNNLRILLFAGGFFTIAFLVGQFAAWQQLNASGHYMVGGPATAFFFLFTGLHGLHMLGGLFVWARACMRLLKDSDVDDVRLSVELCTVYWHFLLLVWLGLYVLLLNT